MMYTIILNCEAKAYNFLKAETIVFVENGSLQQSMHNLPGNLPGAAAPEPNTSELMRPEGQANWLVHEIAHLRLSHSVETVLESVHSGTINSTLQQSIPPVNNPLRKEKAP